MGWKKEIKTLKQLALPIVVLILVYFIVGTIAIFLGAVIYPHVQEGLLELRLSNNTALSLPFVNAVYTVKVSADKVPCIVNTNIGGVPCSETTLDMGLILPGEHKSYFARIDANTNFNRRAGNLHLLRC
ncbi:MAG: hypothetical protein WCW13_02165 [archaeon]|jgi:hypothetical protein